MYLWEEIELDICADLRDDVGGSIDKTTFSDCDFDGAACLCASSSCHSGEGDQSR